MSMGLRLQGLRTQSLHAAGRAAVLVLVIAMLLSQTLGLMHRMVHSDITPIGYDLLALREAASQAHAHSPTSAHDHAHDPAHTHGADCDHGSGWVAQLFGQHSDDSDCRIMDASSGFDVLVKAPALMDAAQSAPLFMAFMSARAALAALALFEARGPPATR
jgi:hypothetical protein